MAWWKKLDPEGLTVEGRLALEAVRAADGAKQYALSNNAAILAVLVVVLMGRC